MSELTENNIALKPHDHNDCITRALEQAQQICHKNGARLTSLREKVLLLVWQSHKPLGAYNIMAQFSDDESKPAAPPTIYRALEFLRQQGLVHKIESLNAYAGCTRPNHNNACQFLLCRDCGIALEMASSNISEAIHLDADKYNFIIDHATIEISGLCPQCQS